MTRKRSVQAQKTQDGFREENKCLLSLDYSSKKEFNNDFKSYVGTPKAKEFYFQVLTKLREAVLANETAICSKLLNLVDYINSLDPETHAYSHESENPLKDSNLVILACKHNRPEIVKCLLNCGLKILNILSSDKPELIDSEKHNAFYYAIRTGNIELLDTLINKWPNEYFASNPRQLDDVLANAYAELKLKNVLLSDEVELYIENKLLDLLFSSNSSSQVKCSQNNLDSLKDRIKLVTENIDFLRTNYSNEQEVNDKFIYVAKFIAQNIHILKRQLRSTYEKLPWEELEFCLICFVSSFIKQKEINLFYKWTLNKGKILTFLENFSKKLKQETEFINCITYKLTTLPNSPREQIVAEILKKCPEFEELYSDYQELRDVSSLEKVSDYLKLALSADLQEREGKLVITRVVQVIGEYLKNTLESPKLSQTTSDRLLLSLPRGTRKIFNDLRNTLSHSHSLSKRMEFEDKANPDFFTGMKRDMKKIDTLVTDILHRHKMKYIAAILKGVANVKSPIEVKAFSEILSNVALNEKISENIEIKEHEKLEKLVKKLKDIIIDKTDYEKELFKQIDEIINSTHGQEEDFEKKYEFGLQQLEHSVMLLSGGRTDTNFIETLKVNVDVILNYINPDIDSHNIKKIVELSKKISDSVGLRADGKTLDQLEYFNFEILRIAVYENDLKWIEELREKLMEKASVQIQKQDCLEDKYENKLKLKQRELQNYLTNEGLCSPASKTLAPYKKNKKLLSVVEMLLLDIMSILETSKKMRGDNHSFLDNNFPLLTGKCLRNHLAHDNALIDLLLRDPVATVVLNAQKFINIDDELKNLKKTGMSLENSPSTFRVKFNQELVIVNEQHLMFNALKIGDLLSLKNCVQNGADIYARSINLQTSPHFASMASNVDVVKYIHSLGVNFNVQDVAGKTPLHIAAELGTQVIVEFLIKEAGLPVDGIDDTGKTPLHYAAKNGHMEVIGTLLKNKAGLLSLDFCNRSPIHYAIVHNRLDVVEILIKEDFDINETFFGYFPLYVAAQSGHIEIVEFLLQNKADASIKNGEGEMPLHVAARNGYNKVVVALIKKGVDVNSQTLDGHTALHLAAKHGHEQVVCSLLQLGASFDICDKVIKSTPLHMAASEGHKKVVAALLKKKSNPNVSAWGDVTPLITAATKGHLEIVTDLLKYNADVHAKDRLSFTSLHYAAKCGHREISEILIRYGAKVDAKVVHDVTALHLAAGDGHKEVVDFLIKNKAKINAKNMAGDTPLHFAATAGRVEVIEILIKCKANINAENNLRVTPLFFAARGGHKDSVICLIKNKAEVNSVFVDGNTPLHGAIFGGHRDIVEILIQNEARINVASNSGVTPLFLAIQAGRKDIAELLLANDAHVNATNNNSTPLLSAIKLNQNEVLEVLLKNGADVNVEDGKAIFYAIFAGFKDIVDILLKYNAPIDFKGTNNSTFLHIAAQRGNKKIVTLLINKGMKVDAKTVDNETPLHFACRDGHDGIVEVLIVNQANVNVVSVEGAPLLIAARYGHDRVVELLLNNGAKINTTDDKNRAALQVAVTHGHLKVVKILLQHNIESINLSDDKGLTLLHIACQKKYFEMVKYLVKKGSNINEEKVLGHKPVHIAAREGGKDIVEFFLRNGVTINDVDSDERTILHHAAISGRLDVVKYLLDNGAGINFKDTNGWTAMHFAANSGSTATLKDLLEYGAFYDSVDKLNRKPLKVSNDESVKKLLESTEKLFDAIKFENYTQVQIFLKDGAFVNAKNANYGTPLHYAAWKGNVKVISILLEHGASPTSVCLKGFTPLHYAAQCSHLKAILALLGAGAIYNAVSNCGKTPLNFSNDKRISSLLRLVNTSFEKVQNGRCIVIDELSRINDIEMVKAILNASNRENHTLVVAATLCNFPKIEELKQIFQGNVDKKISRAYALSQQGDYQVSLSILKSIFEERKKIFGLNNPATIDIDWHTARILIQQGKFQDSLSILENICTKEIAMFGMYHKNTLSTKYEMARLLYKLEKHEEAISIFNEIYPKQKEILGPNHIDTLCTQTYMPLVMEKLGKHEEALTLIQTGCEKLRSVYGENHKQTIHAQENMGIILTTQQKFEEALKVYSNILEKKKIVYGLNDRETTETLHNIATIFLLQKKYRNALSTFQKVLDSRRKYLGPSHPDTLSTQFQMAGVLISQGNSIEGMQICREIFEPVKVALGVNHGIFLGVSELMEKLNLGSELTHGVDASGVLQKRQKEMNTAASNGDTEAVKLLIKDGFHVNDKDVDGRPPLYYAICGGHTDVVNLLLESGADPTQTTKKGNTSLHTAVSTGQKEIVDILLRNVNQDKLSTFINFGTLVNETTSLHVAAKNGSLETVKSLLKYGAIYNVLNKEGKTPVELSQDKNVSSFLKLVDEFFESTVKGNLGLIPKLKALKSDEFAAVTSARNNLRNTLLQVASINKHQNVAIQLLQLLKKANRN